MLRRLTIIIFAAIHNKKENFSQGTRFKYARCMGLDTESSDSIYGYMKN